MKDQVPALQVSNSVQAGSACYKEATVLSDCNSQGRKLIFLKQGQFVNVVFEYEDDIFIDVEFND